MPPKRGYRKKRSYNTRKKRTYVKKRRNNAKVRVAHGIGGISDTTLLKLKFAYMARLEPVTSEYRLVFKGNMPFEPAGPGSGTTAGFNDWMDFYRKFQVNASKIKVTAVAVGSDASAQNTVVNCYPTTDSFGFITLLTPQELMSNPYNKMRLITTSASQGAKFMINNYMSVKKLYGVDELDESLASQNYNPPSFIQNPTQEMNWIVQLNTLDGHAGAITDFQVQLTYYIKLFDRKPLPITN